MNTQHLFSYGTLAPEHAPPEIIPVVRKLRRVGTGIVHGRMYDFGEYPGAVLDEAGSTIIGTVFRLPSGGELLEKLDEYEGFDPDDPAGSLFVRRECPVQLDDGGKLRCWIYLYNRDPGAAPIVRGGAYSRTKTTLP